MFLKIKSIYHYFTTFQLSLRIFFNSSIQSLPVIWDTKKKFKNLKQRATIIRKQFKETNILNGKL